MPNSIRIVEVINWSQKSCTHMNANYRIPLSRNCSRMGKADPGLLCQWTPQCSLEALVKTQVTHTWLVKTGGVHHTVTESEWSINLQNFPTRRWAGKSGQMLRWTFWTSSSWKTLHTAKTLPPNMSTQLRTKFVLFITDYKIISNNRVKDATQNNNIFTGKDKASNPVCAEAKCKSCCWLDVCPKEKKTVSYYWSNRTPSSWHHQPVGGAKTAFKRLPTMRTCGNNLWS